MSNVEPQDGAVSEVCYKHADRSTGVSCQRCDRLICGECAHQASVGVHCPECTKGTKQKVYTSSNMPGSQGRVTQALVGINVAIFVLTIFFLDATVVSAGSVFRDFGTYGFPIAENFELWRIFSGGFIHSGVIHIGFNMYLLWQLGLQLERVLGERDYLAVYFTTLIAGSLGALVLSPLSPTGGASGAVFGLIGFTVFVYRSRNIGLFDTGLGFLIVINVLFSFRGGVSLGGHGGGLLAGLLLGVIYFGMNPGDGPLIPESKKRFLITVSLGVVMFGLCYLAATTWMNPLFQTPRGG